jgi:hypothetical protein
MRAAFPDGNPKRLGNLLKDTGRCLWLAGKKTVVGTYELAKALPSIIGDLLGGRWSGSTIKSSRNVQAEMARCEESNDCRRALARNTILYHEKNPDGSWKISDEELDRLISPPPPNQKRSFNEIHQQALHDRVLMQNDCSKELGKLRRQISADGEEWTLERHKKVYDSLEKKFPHCPGLLKLALPYSQEECIKTDPAPFQNCLSIPEKIAVGTVCLGDEFSDGVDELVMDFCGNTVQALIPVPLIGPHVGTGLRSIPFKPSAAGAGAMVKEAAASTDELTESQAKANAESGKTSRVTLSETAAKNLENEARFERRKRQAVREQQIGARSPERQSYIDENLDGSLTSTAENEKLIAIAENQVSDGKTQVFVVENSKMKFMNDTLGDKDLVTSLTNRHNKILLGKLDALQKKYPGLVITRYTDFKSVHFAVQGKVPKNIRDEIDKAIKDAKAEFTAEAKAKKLIRDGDDPTNWFQAGCAGTGRGAAAAARAARSLTPGLHCRGDEDVERSLNASLEDAHSMQNSMQSDLGKTSLFEGTDGSRVPTQKTFDLIRKNKTAAELATAIRKLPGYQYFSEVDAQRLIDYGKKSDELSPPLYIPTRTQVSFDEADYGGMSSDFLGLGSANQKATAEAVQNSKNIDEAMAATTSGEKTVTTEFERRKNAYATKVGNSMCSGDDCGSIAKMRAWTAADKQRRINDLNADPLTRETRHAFFPAGVAKADRPILALHGESIEKILRKELSDMIPDDRLQSMTFGIDMQTTVVNDGRIGVFTGVNGQALTTQEQKKISDALTRAIREYNRKKWQEDGIPSGYWGF